MMSYTSRASVSPCVFMGSGFQCSRCEAGKCNHQMSLVSIVNSFILYKGNTKEPKKRGKVIQKESVSRYIIIHL